MTNKFFRGLMIALPISLIMWAIITKIGLTIL